MEPMTWRHWRACFEARAVRPRPPICEDHPADPTTIEHIKRSLAVFQLGESGEGRITREIYRAALRGIDDDYRVSLGLFVAEEGRHARILGDILRSLGGEPITHTWSENLFRFGRRLMGIRLKLVVLLAAEVIGMVFYSYLANAFAGSSLGKALDEVIEDEQLHWRFHIDFFQNNVAGTWGRVALCALWLLVGSAACITVAWDHRRTLRALGVGPGRLLHDAARHLQRTGRAILEPGPITNSVGYEGERHAA